MAIKIKKKSGGKSKQRTCQLKECDNKLTKNQKKFCSREHYQTYTKQESKSKTTSTEVAERESTAVAEGDPSKLNPRQEKFCQLYATSKEFLGNGVQSYIEAYDVSVGHGEGQMTYKTCRSSATQILSNMNVEARINQLLDAQGLNDEHVDKQLLLLINQFSDLRTKMQAIKEYNRMKKRGYDDAHTGHNFIFNLFKGVHAEADRLEEDDVTDIDHE